MTPEQPIGPDNSPEPIPPITPDTPTVAAGDLSAHHLTKELAQARISLQRTRIFTIVALLLIGGELTYITAKFSRSFQPQNAAEIADGMVMEQIEDHGDQLSEAIQQRIPEMIAQSPDYVLQQMPSYRQSIEDKVTDNLNDYFKTSSQTLGDNLDKFLDTHQDDVKQLLLNANDTDTIHKVGLDLKQQMLTDIQTPQPGGESVGQQIDQSLKSLHEVETTMHRLAANKGLTPDEKKTRRALAIIAGTIETNKDQLTLPAGAIPTVAVASTEDTAPALAPPPAPVKAIAPAPAPVKVAAPAPAAVPPPAAPAQAPVKATPPPPGAAAPPHP